MVRVVKGDKEKAIKVLFVLEIVTPYLLRWFRHYDNLETHSGLVKGYHQLKNNDLYSFIEKKRPLKNKQSQTQRSIHYL